MQKTCNTYTEYNSPKTEMEKQSIWQKMRKVLINKYVITLFVFALIFVFVGEQSLLNQVSRAIEIRKIRTMIQEIETNAHEAENVLQSLENPDSLERFAREVYRMHEDGERVFIVE